MVVFTHGGYHWNLSGLHQNSLSFERFTRYMVMGISVTRDWVKIAVWYYFPFKSTSCSWPQTGYNSNVFKYTVCVFATPIKHALKHFISLSVDGRKRRQGGGMNNSHGPFWRKAEQKYGERLSFVRGNVPWPPRIGGEIFGLGIHHWCWWHG